MTKAGEDRPMMGHEYDGIQEYDNPLPRWWVWLFILTILFVPVYYLTPGDIFDGAKKDAMYAKEMAAFKLAHPEAPMVTAEPPSGRSKPARSSTTIMAGEATGPVPVPQPDSTTDAVSRPSTLRSYTARSAPEASRTRHGPVPAAATSRGRPWATSRARSSSRTSAG